MSEQTMPVSSRAGGNAPQEVGLSMALGLAIRQIIICGIAGALLSALSNGSGALQMAAAWAIAAFLGGNLYGRSVEKRHPNLLGNRKMTILALKATLLIIIAMVLFFLYQLSTAPGDVELRAAWIVFALCISMGSVVASGLTRMGLGAGVSSQRRA